MKISLRWMEEVLGKKINLSPQELANILLHLGFEVSSIQTFQKCSGVVVSEILEIAKHPNADRLRIAKVTDSKETLDVVCGAPNIEVGQKVFWAKVGAVLGDGEQVKESAIRGVKSPGMICSAKELGVGEDHSGIWSLNKDLPLGSFVEELLQSEDSILEVEVTPNRPDCLSVIGIARELAAALGFAVPSLDFIPPSTSAPFHYPVEIEDKKGCLQYVAKKFEDVVIASSPLNLQTFLIRCRIRPWNNVVDITNYVLLETGHPLHAFDADKLEGGKIIVRRARDNEKILALDGKTYELSPDILVIADEKKPVAIAGIMGGEETAVTHQTKNVLLESAVFDRTLIRSGRNKLKLSSESSYRFERGVSRWSCLMASTRAESMITQIAKGRVSAFGDLSSETPASLSITVRVSQVEKILGEKISPSEIQTVFQKLGIPVLFSDRDTFKAQNPGWRLDLNLEIDYIEEIARLKKYEKISSAGTQIRLVPSSEKDHFHSLKKKARFLLQAMGFYESYNYGFVSKKNSRHFCSEEFLVELANPLAEDETYLRPTLLIELFKNVRQNLSYQKKEIRLFEIGTVFKKLNDSFLERTFLSGVACGKTFPLTWQLKNSTPVDFFWIKGIVEKILNESDIVGVYLQKRSVENPDLTENVLHPFYSCEILAGPDKKKIGFLGLPHPAILKEFDLPENTVLFEVDLGEMEKNVNVNKKAQSVPRTPFIQRDCSIWVKEEIDWDELLAEIHRAGGSLLENCQLFDLYRDQEHPHLKSLSFTFTFRHLQETLNDEKANEMRDKVVEHLRKKFGADLRKK